MKPTISTTAPPPQMRVVKPVNDDFAKKEQQLKDQLASLDQQKKQHEADLKIQEAARLKQLRENREAHLEDARQYEELSLRAVTAEDKTFYVQEARNARKLAAAISLPEDKIEAQEPEHSVSERPGFFEKILSSVGTVWGAMAIFIIVAIISNIMVFKIADEINAINKVAETAGNLSQMVPPSIGKMSFQKGWFTWMTISIDLIALIVIMALIAPDKLYFLLPFTKQSVRAWKPFSNQTEEQKQWQSFAYVALILLFLAISHLGGK